MSQNLPRGEIQKIELTKNDERKPLRTFLRTPDDNKSEHLLEGVSEYPTNKH